VGLPKWQASRPRCQIGSPQNGGLQSDIVYYNSGMNIFTPGWQNSKTAKSDAIGSWATIIQHFAPAKLSGHEVCASRSDGCTLGCLNTAGKGAFSTVKQARVNRTLLFFNDRLVYKKQAIKEVELHCRRCEKLGVKPCARLNGTSDLIWEKLFPELFGLFPNVQFYDYTKHVKRCTGHWSLPQNYHLTFSRSENNQANVDKVLTAGLHNVAVVFGPHIPDNWLGLNVYNGDNHDLRFTDPKAPIVGLKAKGKARRDNTGFVVRVGG